MRGPSASPCVIKLDLILLYVSFRKKERLGGFLLTVVNMNFQVSIMSCVWDDRKGTQQVSDSLQNYDSLNFDVL